jgi:hypothetical protein
MGEASLYFAVACFTSLLLESKPLSPKIMQTAVHLCHAFHHILSTKNHPLNTQKPAEFAPFTVPKISAAIP